MKRSEYTARVRPRALGAASDVERIKGSNLRRRILHRLIATVAALIWLPSTSNASTGALPSQNSPRKSFSDRIILVDNPDSTITAIVQLGHVGRVKPAWVIPVRGKPKLGLSSSVAFRRLDEATAPEY